MPSPSCWYRLLVCGYYSLEAAKGWGVVAIVADSPKRPHRAPGYPGDDGRPDDLNDLEREMLGAAQTGELLRREGPFDLESMQAWGTDRSIRAGTLRQLLVAAQGQVHAKGVRLQGVLISGQLDLESATLRCPLHLDSCYLADPAAHVAPDDPGGVASLLASLHAAGKHEQTAALAARTAEFAR